MVEEGDKSFIKMVSRNDQMFQNRQMTFTTVKNGEFITVPLSTIPNDTIVCDGCNSLIKSENIGLFMLDLQTCWGTQCEKCVKKYFSKIPLVWDNPPENVKAMSTKEYVNYLNDIKGEE